MRVKSKLQPTKQTNKNLNKQIKLARFTSLLVADNNCFRMEMCRLMRLYAVAKTNVEGKNHDDLMMESR